MSLKAVPKNTDDGVWDLTEIEDKTMTASQWGAVGPKTYKAFPVTHNRLPSGAYLVTVDRNDDRPVYIKRDIQTDELLRFKDSWADTILEEIDLFWSRGEAFRKIGFLHRRGYLLYGPQGTGKSSVVQQIVMDIISRDGVVLICGNPKFLNAALTTFRQAEPDRNIVCVFEDIDAIIKQYGEDELLSILDGANMVNRVLNIATTNYPESLDPRIVSRPRRFDRVLKIEAPSDKIREEFLKKKLPKKSDVKKWLKATNGLSFASLTEAIISVCCLGNEFEPTIEILKEMQVGSPNSSEFGKRLGFGADHDDDDDDGIPKKRPMVRLRKGGPMMPLPEPDEDF